MNILIDTLSTQGINEFYQVFTTVLKEDFPGYTQAVINYFLTKAYNISSYHYWITTGWKIVFIAREEGKIIGFAVVDKPYGGVCFCRWLGVLKDFRQKGAGIMLIQKWEEYAKTYGCHKIEIASQPEAKPFYDKCRLNLEGMRKLSYFGIDQYIYGKVLANPKDEIMIKD